MSILFSLRARNPRTGRHTECGASSSWHLYELFSLVIETVTIDLDRYFFFSVVSLFLSLFFTSSHCFCKPFSSFVLSSGPRKYPTTIVVFFSKSCSIWIELQMRMVMPHEWAERIPLEYSLDYGEFRNHINLIDWWCNRIGWMGKKLGIWTSQTESMEVGLASDISARFLYL